LLLFTDVVNAATGGWSATTVWVDRTVVLFPQLSETVVVTVFAPTVAQLWFTLQAEGPDVAVPSPKSHE
jgi:hypothetical protein